MIGDVFPSTASNARGRGIVLAILAGWLLTSCALFRPSPPSYDPIELASGVLVQDVLVPEEGPRAREGDLIRLHYRLALADGTQVDSSFDRGQPVEVRIGEAVLPRGIEEGILGMRLYGQRRLVVPPAEAYGPEGLPPHVPPDAVLHVDLELMGLELSP